METDIQKIREKIPDIFSDFTLRQICLVQQSYNSGISGASDMYTTLALNLLDRLTGCISHSLDIGKFNVTDYLLGKNGFESESDDDNDDAELPELPELPELSELSEDSESDEKKGE